MFADFLQARFPHLNIRRINKIQGQPFLVEELVDAARQIIDNK